MKYLLIPSRHILYSKDQYDAILDHLKQYSYDKVIFAITSYNLNNCKYSPIDIYYRISIVDSLIFSLLQEIDFRYSIVRVPHFNQRADYAQTIVKYINYNSHYHLLPENTEVFLLGQYIAKEFENAGFTIFLAEHVGHTQLFKKLFIEKDSKFFQANISDASHRIFQNQTEILEIAEKIWLDTVLQEKGSLTENRNYHTYTYAMSNNEIIEFKYNDIKDFIKEGKIIDEGCADAALFIPISRDYPDSDLIGVDISNDFIAQAHERIRQGYFGQSFVTMVQANLLNKIFHDDFADTVICNSTMHEIWSYNKKLESLKMYLRLKHDQLVTGGRLIIRDVLGPTEKEQLVCMRSTKDDNQLFKKFMLDFKHVRPQDIYQEISIHGESYIQTNLKIITEYLLHKDYLDNWESEMNEEFCHFSESDWLQVLKDVGFSRIQINPYVNEWIVEHRFKNEIILLDDNGNTVPYPKTNVVIVAEK